MFSHDLPRLGDVIAGKYVVEDVLGAGGMGVILPWQCEGSIARWHRGNGV